MKYILAVMMFFSLTACQNEEKIEAPVVMVEKHQPVNTQAVKKDDITPAVVHENVEKASQAVVAQLMEAQAVVKKPSVEKAKASNPCTVKAMINPCSVKQREKKVNPCATKVKAMVSNPCAAKLAVVANPCSVKKTVNPCSAKLAVTANPCAVKKAVASFNVKKCKACHAVNKKKVGPTWKDIANDYGNVEALAKVFKDGFKVADRKTIAANPKWKSKAGMMTSQYKKMIKGHGDAAAQAFFDAVARGKI